jgi:hypothetical protein
VTASSGLAASRSRVDAVVELVGLGEVGGRRAGRFSLGMGQRLGIATALLGDPATVILDEPLNGLDPQGIRWVRSLLGDLAADGRTVFVSSHLLNELALTAQHLIVIGRGRLLADTGVADFLARAGAAGCGSPAPTRRRWPPGSARARWPSRRAPVGPDRVRAEHRPGRPHRRGLSRPWRPTTTAQRAECSSCQELHFWQSLANGAQSGVRAWSAAAAGAVAVKPVHAASLIDAGLSGQPEPTVAAAAFAIAGRRLGHEQARQLGLQHPTDPLQKCLTLVGGVG